jgi:hypothetical protein
LCKETISIGFSLILVLCLIAGAGETQPKKMLGDQADGSLSTPPHIIPLYPANAKGEKGDKIDPAKANQLPFSARFTCGECHSYASVAKGWHFNSVDSNVPSGRTSEPWVAYNSDTYTQIPLSYRSWKGTYRPSQFGISEFMFTLRFGRHMPGGGPGDVNATEIEDIGRQSVSGKLEINCLICHDAHIGLNMGGTNGYALQVSARQNFRWAAAASSEFASVAGQASAVSLFYDPFGPVDPTEKNAPKVTYNKGFFNDKLEVLFDIVREVPNERCYFCHSEFSQVKGEKGEQAEKWTQDRDIHIAAGLKCVDCHRNGIEHNIVRGYDGESEVSDNPMVDVTTCESCHISSSSHYDEALSGRFAAPIAVHPGIPAVHFDKLTCTACHSGIWPKEQTVLTKTSKIHMLGIPNSNKDPEALPHVVSPVFASLPVGSGIENGEKIGPYRALWPSFWGTMKDQKVEPIRITTVEEVIPVVLKDANIVTVDGWPELTEVKITTGIKGLTGKVGSDAGKVVYIGGGKIYSLDEAEKLTITDNHPAAEPYLWPIAHNVRPAAQALGVRYCTDCHATKAPLLFGDIRIDSPVVTDRGTTRQMIDSLNISPSFAWAFAASFVFRPWLKIISLTCCAVIAGVLLWYALRALGCIAKVLSGQR